jgi:hypothetical protein
LIVFQARVLSIRVSRRLGARQQGVGCRVRHWRALPQHCPFHRLNITGITLNEYQVPPLPVSSATPRVFRHSPCLPPLLVSSATPRVFRHASCLPPRLVSLHITFCTCVSYYNMRHSVARVSPDSLSLSPSLSLSLSLTQVQRGNTLSQRQGLGGQCKSVQGDFMKLPFPDNSFDGVVQILIHQPPIKSTM